MSTTKATPAITMPARMPNKNFFMPALSPVERVWRLAADLPPAALPAPLLPAGPPDLAAAASSLLAAQSHPHPRRFRLRLQTHRPRRRATSATGR
jgi:hypothetical protein